MPLSKLCAEVMKTWVRDVSVYVFLPPPCCAVLNEKHSVRKGSSRFVVHVSEVTLAFKFFFSLN